MHNVNVAVPVPYMLTSLERKAYIDSALKEKALHMNGIIGKITSATYNEELDVLHFELELTDGQKIEWDEAMKPKMQSVSMGVK